MFVSRFATSTKSDSTEKSLGKRCSLLLLTRLDKKRKVTVPREEFLDTINDTFLSMWRTLCIELNRHESITSVHTILPRIYPPLFLGFAKRAGKNDPTFYAPNLNLTTEHESEKNLTLFWKMVLLCPDVLPNSTVGPLGMNYNSLCSIEERKRCGAEKNVIIGEQTIISDGGHCRFFAPRSRQIWGRWVQFSGASDCDMCLLIILTRPTLMGFPDLLGGSDACLGNSRGVTVGSCNGGHGFVC